MINYPYQLPAHPIAIGVPTSDGRVVLDMTTAAIAWYGLIQAQQRGEPIPDGIAYDENGVFTTDPGAALQGAILAFAGHKGSGLALMVEVLTGPLIGTNIAGDEERTPNFGDLFIALNPAAFGGADTFLSRVDVLMAKVKAGRRVAGGGEILLPGERGNRRTQTARADNRTRIDKALYSQLLELAGE